MGFRDFLRSAAVAQQLAPRALRKPVLVTTSRWDFLATQRDLGNIALSDLADNIARVETEPQQMLLDPSPRELRWNREKLHYFIS